MLRPRGERLAEEEEEEPTLAGVGSSCSTIVEVSAQPGFDPKET
jgi:hypothetical protein